VDTILHERLKLYAEKKKYIDELLKSKLDQRFDEGFADAFEEDFEGDGSDTQM